MEVKIGITHVSREVTISAKQTSEEIIEAWKQAQTDGGLLELEDKKGRKLVVPVERIGYLDLGAADARPVGFGTV